MVSRQRPRFEGVPPLRYLGHTEAPPPVWLEARAALESLRLARHPVLAGNGLPRGDGRPVLLIPGFMSGDRSLATMRRWLVRLGYRPELPGLTFNIRYSEAVVSALLPRVVRLFRERERRVTLVGHSRGGLLAKVMADRRPELVERVVALGSPLADPFDVHPLTMAGVRAAQLLNFVWFRSSSRVEQPFMAQLAAPARVPLTSIYSRSDGIVHWEACLRPDAVCREVPGSHLGLPVNPAVYSLLAHVLAEPAPPPA